MTAYWIPSSWRRAARRAGNCAANVVDPPRVILTWHRIGSDGRPDPARLGVAPERFRAQLAVLQRMMPVIPLDQIRTVRHRAAVITFDDGYADNLHEAAPALQAAELPATVFVTSGLVGSRVEGWWDRLVELLLEPAELPAQCPADLVGVPGGAPTATAEQRRKLYHHLAHRCRTAPASTVALLLAGLAAWAGVRASAVPRRRFLDDGELMRLAEVPGIRIGSHTCSHPSLAHLPIEACRRELTDSRETLESACGRPVTALAYPYGTRDDVADPVVAAAGGAGYRTAVTTDPGQVHRWSDPLRLRRHTVRDWDGPEFARRLARFLVASDHGEEAACA